jgi:hypothetical protein
VIFVVAINLTSFRTPRSGDPESITPVYEMSAKLVIMDSGFASFARAPE